MARVCSEFIPKFSTTERSIVIYPVSNNWAKYNMGFFIGNKAWRPQYICWKNEGDPIRLMQVRMVQPLNVKTK